MATALLTAYFTALACLALLGLHRLRLVLAARRAPPRPPRSIPDSEKPEVLVQLPIYNEALVAERLIRAAVSLRWPADRLHVQVLDDSTDETSAIVSRVVDDLRSAASAGEGPRISILRRRERTGFKAGALAEGLARSAEPFVAIFDADFVPPPDFLEAIVPQLHDPDIGLVQARWGHLNRDQSLLTRAQATFLDAHFGVEHRGREVLGVCFNFNGTAGVWRRTAIELGGGWSAETLTEDLDLSYRAQLAGVRFRYVDAHVVPAELPETWSAFRAQQGRWVRGSVETTRKLLGAVLRHRAWSKSVKLEALAHLGGNFAYALMAIIAVTLPACVLVRDALGFRVPGGITLLSALDTSMLTAGTLAMLVFYASSSRLSGRSVSKDLPDILFALALGAGLSLSNFSHILRALGSERSEFVRTPKRGDEIDPRRTYKAPPGLGMSLVELVFAAYFLAAIALAISRQLWAAMPFLLLYFVGFLAVGGGSVLEALRRERVELVAPRAVGADRS